MQSEALVQQQQHTICNKIYDSRQNRKYENFEIEKREFSLYLSFSFRIVNIVKIKEMIKSERRRKILLEIVFCIWCQWSSSSLSLHLQLTF